MTPSAVAVSMLGICQSRILKRSDSYPVTFFSRRYRRRISSSYLLDPAPQDADEDAKEVLGQESFDGDDGILNQIYKFPYARNADNPRQALTYQP